MERSGCSLIYSNIPVTDGTAPYPTKISVTYIKLQTRNSNGKSLRGPNLEEGQLYVVFF
jgi:hypothetical protein